MSLLNQTKIIIQKSLLVIVAISVSLCPSIYAQSVDYSKLNYVGSAYYYDTGKAIDPLLLELQTLTKNSQIPLESFKPEIFNINLNGTLVKQDWIKPEYFNKFHSYASNIIPTIKGDTGYPNSGVPSWHLLVKSVKSRSNAIDQIINYLNTNNLQGIEINFEPSLLNSPTVDGQKLTQTDKQNYLQFLEDLGFYLKQNNKKLLIATPPIMTYDNPEQLFDYKSLLNRPTLMNYLDKITIMGYDLNYGNNYFSSIPNLLLDELLIRAQKDFGKYPEKIAIGQLSIFLEIL